MLCQRKLQNRRSNNGCGLHSLVSPLSLHVRRPQPPFYRSLPNHLVEMQGRSRRHPGLTARRLARPRLNKVLPNAASGSARHTGSALQYKLHDMKSWNPPPRTPLPAPPPNAGDAAARAHTRRVGIQPVVPVHSNNLKSRPNTPSSGETTRPCTGLPVPTFR